MTDECNFDSRVNRTSVYIPKQNPVLTINTAEGSIKIDDVKSAQHLEKIIEEHARYKTALAYEDVVHENEHLKACLKADNDIQNRIIKLSEPFMNIQLGKTYSAYHALDTVENIVKAYADLPSKIVELRKETDTGDLDIDIEAEITNKTLDDIIAMLKEGESQKG
jgi:cell fate (sporulation/competence/biofilm development) regulator YlbF (YheA/YmcA/DUF963 family)